jgi:hypothetical protein
MTICREAQRSQRNPFLFRLVLARLEATLSVDSAWSDNQAAGT